ncbi:MAG: serine/threonine-protein kinase [Candidatus Brocadiaceae bacterium]|jgi:serine/threonine protein kinase
MQEELTEGAPKSIGQCRIEKKIGEGGMGSVYLGRHKTLDIPRAIKVLPKHIDLKDPEYSQRFFREARIAAHLRHPNMVQVHECGAEEGYYYLIMDYVEGPTCRELVEQQGKLDWREAVRVTRQIGEGLKYAADQGIIHRDVTPGNIIIDSDGTAKITDLGLAKETATDATGLTRSGASLGTPYYMSPEQINSARDVDFRTDIYSLGATLYHMVCGTVPYTGTTFEVMTKQVREPLPSPKKHVPDLPDDLCDILRKMMAKSPEDRYSNYDALTEDLESLLDGKPVSAAGFRDQSMVDVQEMPAGVEGEPIDRALEKTQIANPPGRGNRRLLIALVVVGVLIALAIVLSLTL